MGGSSVLLIFVGIVHDLEIVKADFQNLIYVNAVDTFFDEVQNLYGTASKCI